MELSRLESDEVRLPLNEQFAIDVLLGLSSTPKKLSPKYFYDDIGSELFQKITQHSDYYPARTELEILNYVKDELPTLFEEEEIDIIELGAGDGHKSQLILDGLLKVGKRVNFFPIDISEKAMKQLGETIVSHENLTIHGVVSEYLTGLRFLRKKSKNRQLVLFLGSNIGNFDREQGQSFLRLLWKSLNQDDMLLTGFDLKKDVKTLTTAYNDSNGYTHDFNLNLLTRINRELGGDFDRCKFQHVGVYNPILGAMESYLLPMELQTVYLKELQRSFHFEAYEPLHLEYSFKFSKPDIELLSEQTGFSIEKNFAAENDYFMDSLWRVSKETKQ